MKSTFPYTMHRAQFPHWLYFRLVYQRSSGLSSSRGQVRQVDNEGASQINYILQVVQPILENHISSLEVDVGPTDAYNKMLHSSLGRSVFAQCMSWYRVGGTGKITNGFPLYVIFLLFVGHPESYRSIIRPASVFWLWLRKPNWNHYNAISPDGWLERQLLRQRRRQQVWWALALGVVIVTLRPHWRESVLGWCNI